MTKPLRTIENTRRRVNGLLLAAITLSLLGLLALAVVQYARSAAAPASPAPATPMPAASATVPPAATLMLPLPLPPPTSDGPRATLTAPTVQVVNGLAIELHGAQRDGDTLLVDLCYQFPTAATNWLAGGMLGDVTLQAQGDSLPMFSSALTGWQTSPAGAAIGRCDQITFRVPASLDLTDFTLNLNRLRTITSESPDCGPVQDKLNRAGTGILIACHTGDHSFGWEVVTHPVTLTDSAASSIAQDAFSDIVAGPWVFAGHLPPVAARSPVDLLALAGSVQR